MAQSGGSLEGQTLPPLGNSWNHFWLSQLGMPWHPGARGQGCGQTHYNAQDSPSHKDYPPKCQHCWGAESLAERFPPQVKQLLSFKGSVCLWADSWHAPTYFAVSVPQGQDEVPQGQVHGGVSRILWELIELIQLHHVRPHAQGFAALIGLVERLEVPVHAWNWQKHKEANPPAVTSKFGQIKE